MKMKMSTPDPPKYTSTKKDICKALQKLELRIKN